MNAREDGRQGHWYDPTALAETENLLEPRPTYLQNTTSASLPSAVASPSREIPLTNGLVTIVDECDYEMLSRFKWRLVTLAHYAGCWTWGSKRQTYMHRMIMLPDPDLTVDHINHDTLDNRRANLRVCTKRQNFAGRLSRKGSTSRFKGVSWNHYRWQANCQGVYLGTFADEAEAALTYDAAARELYGEFAALNFPAVTS